MVFFSTPILPDPNVKENFYQLRFCENYLAALSHSKQCFKIVSRDKQYNVTVVETTPNTVKKTIFKVLLVFTVIVPLLAVLGKLIYRSWNNFVHQDYLAKLIPVPIPPSIPPTVASSLLPPTDTNNSKTGGLSGAGGNGIAYGKNGTGGNRYTDSLQQLNLDF